MGKTLKEKVKEVLGTADAMGVMVEGVVARETIKLVNQGKFDKEIREEKTEISAAELAEMEREREEMQREIEERREEFEEEAKKILGQMKEQPASEIKKKMAEAGIPTEIIDEVMPSEEEPAEGGAPAAAQPAPPAED